ncbi:MAG: hypothetical protein H2069_06255 [Legionella sp.]|nr:hypothetical protein [Legionella sp.]
MISSGVLIIITLHSVLEIKVDSIGDRITYCRSSLELTRKELIDLWKKASIPTYCRWELDAIQPNFQKISNLAEFFCSQGLIVSPEWIQTGHGPQPSLLNMQEFREDQFDTLCEESFLDLNKKVKNFLFYKVTTNFFSPIARYGDYVAGVRVDDILPENINTIHAVVFENSVYVGFLENKKILTLKNTQDKVIEFSDYNVLAKVHWTAVRP